MIKISQQEIIDMLEKQTKALSRSELADLTGIDPTNVSRTLKIMIKHHEIKFLEIDRNKAKELYGDKAPCRRMKIYFKTSFEI